MSEFNKPLDGKKQLAEMLSKATRNQSDTPRTDEIEGNLIEFCENQIRFPKMSEHSRTLERELTAARAVLELCPVDYLENAKLLHPHH